MKKIIIFTFCCLNSWFILNAQVEYGIKAGINSIDLISDGIKINEGNQLLKIDYLESGYGHQLGMYARVKFLGFYVEPNFMFNSNKVNYRLTNYTEGLPISVIFNERYYNLDMPLNIGIKSGIFRLYGGPVAHVHITSTSDLIDLKSYNQKFNKATYGYQAGFGFDLWKLRLDVAYEGNLSAFGDHINVDGNSYSFGTSASRILGTLGYKF